MNLTPPNQPIVILDTAIHHPIHDQTLLVRLLLNQGPLLCLLLGQLLLIHLLISSPFFLKLSKLRPQLFQQSPLLPKRLLFSQVRIYNYFIPFIVIFVVSQSVSSPHNSLYPQPIQFDNNLDNNVIIDNLDCKMDIDDAINIDYNMLDYDIYNLDNIMNTNTIAINSTGSNDDNSTGGVNDDNVFNINNNKSLTVNTTTPDGCSNTNKASSTTKNPATILDNDGNNRGDTGNNDDNNNNVNNNNHLNSDSTLTPSIINPLYKSEASDHRVHESSKSKDTSAAIGTLILLLLSSLHLLIIILFVDLLDLQKQAPTSQMPSFQSTLMSSFSGTSILYYISTIFMYSYLLFFSY